MMPKKRKRRLIIICIGLLGISVATTFLFLALNENINAFYSPSKVVNGEAPQDTRFRIGGMVVENSVKRNQTDLSVAFQLTDTAHQVAVQYTGILPDLFREGQGIVAQGALQNGIFIADEVLAKHDESYMPPEVSEALRLAKKNTATE